MADQRVNGNLILIGSQGGTFAWGCQPSGGGFTYLLPTNIPQIGQTLVVSSIYNGNTANMRWSSFPGITSISLVTPSIFTVTGSPVSAAPLWSSGVAYTLGQVVSYAGVSYVALSSNSNQQPDISPAYWAIASSGILSMTLVSQAANTVFAGPASGSAAPPSFRALAIADLPATGTPSNTTFLRGDGTWSPITGVVTSFNGRSGAVLPSTGDYSYSQISGTPQLPQTSSAVSHQWLNAYNATTGLFTHTQPSVADLSDGSTGSGSVVLSTSPTISSPTISGAALSNPTISGTFTNSSAETYTAANPTFFSKTGTGAVVLATNPVISGATLAGTTSFSAANPTFFSSTGTGAVVLAASPSLTGTTNLVNAHITGTLADGTNSVGTSGQVLTSTGTGVAWAAGGGGVQIQTTTVTLTSAQILNLATTPITLIPAQGAGTIIQPIAGAVTYFYNTTPYTPGSPAELTLDYAGAGAAPANPFWGISQGGFIDQATDQIIPDFTILAYSYESQPTTQVINQDFVISAQGNPTAGDGTIRFVINYLVTTA